jgi:hypothetical protein
MTRITALLIIITCMTPTPWMRPLLLLLLAPVCLLLLLVQG